MPVVPSYDNLQTSIRPQAPNLSGPAPGALAAQQMQDAGRAVSGAAGAAGRVLSDMQREANDLRVTDALNSAIQARTDAQLGVLKLRGRDALERPDGKPLPDEAADALRQQYDALRDGLGNDVQKQAFAARSQQLLQQFRAGVGEHVLREYQAHHDQVAEAGIAAAQRQADLNPDSEEMRGQSVQAIRGIVDNVAKRKGWAPEQREAAVIEALSPLHMGVIASRMQRDVDSAVKYFESVESELRPKARADVRQALAQRSAEVRAGSAVRALTADPAWTLAQADKAITAQFGDKPEELRMARDELRYQEQVRRDAQAEQQRELLAPVQQLIGDALNAGRMVGPQERDRAIAGLRLTRPDLYAQGAKLVDQHNDEVRNERLAADADARSTLGMDRALNGAALRYDMLLNPAKYRSAKLMEALAPEVRAGRLSPQDLEQAITVQAQLMKPQKPPEFASLVTGAQHLDHRLRGAVIDGKAWDKLDKDAQAGVKARALQAAEPLLLQLQQATGQKADDQQVKAVIDSLFVQKTYRDTFMGMRYGASFVEQQLDDQGAGQRLVGRLVTDAVSRIPPQDRARIEQALRQAGQPATPEVVLQYWQAGGGAR